jgi:hypothetical protein
MATHVLQLPELLDQILEYLSHGTTGRHSLYTCLFVNRQFHTHAICFLYRHLLFEANPSNVSIGEENLLEQLSRRPALTLHVRSLSLDFTETRYKRDTPVAPLETRIKPILQSSRNLQHVDFQIGTWEESQSSLAAVLAILNDIDSRPELSFWLSDTSVENEYMDDNIQKRGDPIIRIQDRLPIKSLTLFTHWTPAKFSFLSQFRQLTSLSLAFRFATTEGVGWADLETTFKDIPLSNLEIVEPHFIRSLPSSLKSLELSQNIFMPQSLNYITWNAVCRLRELRVLALRFSGVDTWDAPSKFLSNITSFTACLPGDHAIIQQLLQPICSRSSRLTSVTYFLNQDSLSSNLFNYLITANLNLSRLYVESDVMSSYGFHDLGDGSQISPNLKSLALPWPASTGKESDRKMVKSRPPRQLRCGIPEQLTFEHCKQLAAEYPNLDKIEFNVKPEKIASTWSRYWSRGNRTSNMSIQSEKLGEWWTTYVHRLHSIKMAKFIDVSSPCLGVCTQLFYYQDPDCIKKTANYRFRHEIVILLSLNQVRKHSGL